jgi:hypothetical protein
MAALSALAPASSIGPKPSCTGAVLLRSCWAACGVFRVPFRVFLPAMSLGSLVYIVGYLRRLEGERALDGQRVLTP